MSGRVDEQTRAKKERANDYERTDERTSGRGLRTNGRGLRRNEPMTTNEQTSRRANKDYEQANERTWRKRWKKRGPLLLFFLDPALQEPETGARG